MSDLFFFFFFFYAKVASRRLHAEWQQATWMCHEIHYMHMY